MIEIQGHLLIANHIQSISKIELVAPGFVWERWAFKIVLTGSELIVTPKEYEEGDDLNTPEYKKELEAIRSKFIKDLEEELERGLVVLSRKSY